jgi:hypothetical protein
MTGSAAIAERGGKEDRTLRLMLSARRPTASDVDLVGDGSLPFA